MFGCARGMVLLMQLISRYRGCSYQWHSAMVEGFHTTDTTLPLNFSFNNLLSRKEQYQSKLTYVNTVSMWTK